MDGEVKKARQGPCRWFVRPGLLVFLVVCIIDSVNAQESDTLVADHGRRPFAVVDQIADPSEKHAFLNLYDARDAQARVALAGAFLARYPKSWLLAEVYEMAAKACIDLGDYNRALIYGRQSLTLFPENPLLLVPLANALAQQGHPDEAKQRALEALAYLEYFGRPSAVRERDWPQLSRQLEASARFVLGRVAASEALAMKPGPEQTSRMNESLAFLSRARALNPQDPEIVYLMGLDYLAVGRKDLAAGSFAACYRLSGLLKDEALEKLRKIFNSSEATARISFDRFLAKADETVILRSEDSPTETPKSPSPLPEYAGSQVCRTCHVSIFEAWQQTGMARMLRPYRPENVVGDFVQENTFYLGDEVHWDQQRFEVLPGPARSLFARMVIEKGRHYFDIRQSDQQWHRYPVDYTIGSKWQQAYATRLPNGHIQVFPIQYNLLRHRWINFWKIIDVPGSERADPRTWERLDAAMSYQINCTPCHTSQLRNVKGGGFESEAVEFREPGVDCEMCHGPSARHAASMAAGEPYEKKSDDPPVDFNKISSQESVAICAQCHMQSALREPGPHGELNYSRQGGQFYVHFKARPYTEFSFRARYKDGRFRETTFLVEALMRTACYRKGGVTCVHCHDPHPSDAASNKASLRYPGQPDRMCLQCHGEMAGKIEAHTHHPANSEASRCVSCHMPRIANALLFTGRSHQIDDIPNPAMTRRFGQDDSPSACLLCHQDKDEQWLVRQTWLSGSRAR
jgi:predicted CXXCH cytochrome family protein